MTGSSLQVIFVLTGGSPITDPQAEEITDAAYLIRMMYSWAIVNSSIATSLPSDF